MRILLEHWRGDGKKCEKNKSYVVEHSVVSLRCHRGWETVCLPFTVQHGGTAAPGAALGGERVPQSRWLTCSCEHSTRLDKFILALLMELITILDGQGHPSLPKKWQVIPSQRALCILWSHPDSVHNPLSLKVLERTETWSRQNWVQIPPLLLSESDFGHL